MIVCSILDHMKSQIIIALFAILSSPAFSQAGKGSGTGVKHYLYVGVPGIRDYLGYGGHGVLVFDMDNQHRFVKRIHTGGLHPDGKPSNVKGIAVSIPLNSLYVSTVESLQRIDLTTEKIVWEKKFEGGCDRMSISPDGKTMYLPSFENSFWNVIDCATGDIIKKIPVNKRAHNTIYAPSGKSVFLDDIASPWLYVADPKSNGLVSKIGPFANFVRPFTIDGKEQLAFVTVDSLLGFEVGEIASGKKIAHVVVQGWDAGPVRRHGNPSHGIALTPDEKELWFQPSPDSDRTEKDRGLFLLCLQLIFGNCPAKGQSVRQLFPVHAWLAQRRMAVPTAKSGRHFAPVDATADWQ